MEIIAKLKKKYISHGDASWWTAEEENDRISIEKNKLHKKYIVIFSESVFVWLLH